MKEKLTYDPSGVAPGVYRVVRGCCCDSRGGSEDLVWLVLLSMLQCSIEQLSSTRHELYSLGRATQFSQAAQLSTGQGLQVMQCGLQALPSLVTPSPRCTQYLQTSMEGTLGTFLARQVDAVTFDRFI